MGTPQSFNPPPAVKREESSNPCGVGSTAFVSIRLPLLSGRNRAVPCGSSSGLSSFNPPPAVKREESRRQPEADKPSDRFNPPPAVKREESSAPHTPTP